MKLTTIDTTPLMHMLRPDRDPGSTVLSWCPPAGFGAAYSLGWKDASAHFAAWRQYASIGRPATRFVGLEGTVTRIDRNWNRKTEWFLVEIRTKQLNWVLAVTARSPLAATAPLVPGGRYAFDGCIERCGNLLGIFHTQVRLYRWRRIHWQPRLADLIPGLVDGSKCCTAPAGSWDAMEYASRPRQAAVHPVPHLTTAFARGYKAGFMRNIDRLDLGLQHVSGAAAVAFSKARYKCFAVDSTMLPGRFPDCCFLQNMADPSLWLAIPKNAAGNLEVRSPYLVTGTGLPLAARFRQRILLVPSPEYIQPSHSEEYPDE